MSQILIKLRQNKVLRPPTYVASFSIVRVAGFHDST